MWRVLFAVLSWLVVFEIPSAFAEPAQCDAVEFENYQLIEDRKSNV